MFETLESSPESVELIDAVCAAARCEAQATARRLNAVADLIELRNRQYGNHPEWTVDLWDEIARELAAALRVGPRTASGYMTDALVLRERLPKLGQCLAAGDINYPMFNTIANRTALITDEKALAAVDAQLAVRAPRWAALSRFSLATRVDAIVGRHDPDAVRRTKKEIKDRYLDVSELQPGIAEVYGNVLASTGRALDRRLDELAATVCAADPRTRAQRRADALDALVAGAERLACTCGKPDCTTSRGGNRAHSTVIHVIATQDSVDGTSTTPGFMAGADGLIPAKVVAELAKSARMCPVLHPLNAPPEPRYVPSAKLADFVRCRDLTCRAPGCDQPAVYCDIDHTIPYADGGATHASNLKCLCRKHHLLKTFWGWRDKQLPDGTVIWTLPGGRTYVTTPGSAILFPPLTVPTGDLADPVVRVSTRCGERTAMMPSRRRTRAQERSQRITAERNRNRDDRLARQHAYTWAVGYGDPDDPPPF
ncbi:HNH endonuclease signature motif containing protein [Mycobacterium xenopi]|nr:HNH endonuclease signature motif containing protein [Mycobacterium xenopi]ORX19770.1 hypothetical protein AWC32_09240 [Mycobacterium xenopi]